MEEQNKEKGKFSQKFFSWFTGYGKDGKGVSKREVIKGYTFINLFRLYFRRFSAIFSLNILYIICNFPIAFLIVAVSGITSKVSTAPMNPLFSVFYGMQTISGTSGLAPTMFGMYGITSTIHASTTLTYIMYGLSLLDVLLIGPVNMGLYYVMRELVRGEPLFIKDDFFGSMKENWKKGLLFSIFDSAMLFLIGYTVYSYYINYSSYYIMFYASILMAIVYLMMRTYIYLLSVTFDQNVFKILKNSFTFSILGFGKNILALLGCGILIVFVIMLSQFFMPIAIAIALIFLFSTLVYIKVYVAYAKVKKVMLDPYYEKHPEEKPYGWDGEVYEAQDGEITKGEMEDINPPGD